MPKKTSLAAATLLAISALFFANSVVLAQASNSSSTTEPAATTTDKKPAKKSKKSTKKAAAKAEETATTENTQAGNGIDEDDITPNISQSVTYEYHCELKGELTIYTNADDDQHVALRWKNHLHRLTRVETTTGANRFENKKAGLVWISIPAKGMLLDSRHGQQLANECTNAELNK